MYATVPRKAAVLYDIKYPEALPYNRLGYVSGIASNTGSENMSLTVELLRWVGGNDWSLESSYGPILTGINNPFFLFYLPFTMGYGGDFNFKVRLRESGKMYDEHPDTGYLTVTWLRFFIEVLGNTPETWRLRMTWYSIPAGLWVPYLVVDYNGVEADRLYLQISDTPWLIPENQLVTTAEIDWDWLLGSSTDSFGYLHTQSWLQGATAKFWGKLAQTDEYWFNTNSITSTVPMKNTIKATGSTSEDWRLIMNFYKLPLHADGWTWCKTLLGVSLGERYIEFSVGEPCASLWDGCAVEVPWDALAHELYHAIGWNYEGAYFTFHGIQRHYRHQQRNAGPWCPEFIATITPALTTFVPQAQEPEPTQCPWGNPSETTKTIFHYMGDLNNDGVIGVGDAALVSAWWYPGPPVGPAAKEYIRNGGNMDDILLLYDIAGPNGAGDYDGAINLYESALISKNWNKQICDIFKP